MTAQPVEITPKPKTGQLVFKPARRGKPPLHLADFDMAGRKQFLKDAGYPAFRASQLSKHYFERFEADPAAMTDLPAAQRDELAAKALPPLLTTLICCQQCQLNDNRSFPSRETSACLGRSYVWTNEHCTVTENGSSPFVKIDFESGLVLR